MIKLMTFNRHQTFAWYLLCIVLLFAPKLFSEEKGHSLMELKEIALKNNPLIKEAYYQWRSAKEEISIATTLAHPKLSFSEFIESVQTRVGPQERKIQVMQQLPWFGVLKQKEQIAKQVAQNKKNRLTQTILETQFQIEDLILDWILIEKKLKSGQDHLAILEGLEQAQKGKLESGQARLSKVLRIQVEKESLINNLLHFKALLGPKKKALEQNLGQSLPLLKVQELESSFKLARETKGVLAKVKKHNPIWLSHQLDKKIADGRIDLAKKKGKPSIGIGVSWIETSSIQNSQVSGNGDDPIALNLSFDLPIWRSKIKSGVRKEKLVKRALEQRDQQLIDQFKTEIEALLFKLNDSKRQRVLYEKTLIKKAQSAYESTEKAHQAGEVSFQSLLDAERLVLEFKLKRDEAWVKEVKAWVALKKLAGQLDGLDWGKVYHD